jgi:hypothetical protein
LLAEVMQNDQAFSDLMRDEIGHARVLLDRQYAAGRGLRATLIAEGTVIGHLVALRREALIARGQTVDAANDQIKSLIDKGIGLVPVPYASLFGGVPGALYGDAVKSRYAKVGDWLAQHVEQSGGSTAQDEKTAGDEKAVVDLLRQMSLSVAIAHADATGVDVSGEPFARHGKILPIDRWINDPVKVDRFVDWCKEQDFAAPGISQDFKSVIETSHDDAVESFKPTKPGEPG